MLSALKLLIFTDLNDTLLDRNYDFSPASEALDLIRKYDIPLILTSSKSRGQVEIYRRRLRLNYPLIVENGGAICFPPGSFPSGRLPSGCIFQQGEFAFELADKVEHLLPILNRVADLVGAKVRTINEMTVNEIVNLTGMDSEEAELAKGHSYIVYFLCFSGARDLYREFERRGLKMTRGSHFYHLGSTNDKGIAVHKLTSLYRNLGFIDVVTAGLGDNLNDLPMLSAVNYPFLVESPDNGYAEGVELEVLVKLSGSGPIGWNKGVLQLLQKFDFSD